MFNRGRSTPLALTEQEGYVVLEPCFTAIQEVFAQRLPECAGTRLEVRPWVRDSERHFAATEETGRLVVASPDLALESLETVLAVLTHEFGHVADFRYPARFVLLDDGELVVLPELPDTDDDRVQQAAIARMRHWRDRGYDRVELTADAIARDVTGQAISYCGPCNIQCFRGGRPRPAGLR